MSDIVCASRANLPTPRRRAARSLLLVCLAFACTPPERPEPVQGAIVAVEQPQASSAAPPEARPERPAEAEAARDAGAAESDQPSSDPPRARGPGVATNGGDEPSASIGDARVLPCGTPPEGMACVLGGEFWIGADDDGHDCDQPEALEDESAGTSPRHRVWLQTFYIDITEVTYEAYQSCAASGACDAARPLYRDYDAPTQPMTGMDWFQAQAYCESRGGRLPTEAEFEAASGGPDGELTPFGNAPVTCENAIIMDERGRACGVPKRGQHPETGRIFEVASRPAGRYGLHDMVGNAEEWVLDWWAPDYAACGDDCLGDNPRGPCDGALHCDGYRRRVVRGGSWYWPADHATSRHRRRYAPDNDPAHHFGFRCVVESDPATDHAASPANAP